jgi:hypothetical protein
MPDEPNPHLLLAYRRALTLGDSALVQVHFHASVLDKYRGAPGFELIRTNTVGRIKREGGWTIDLGIGEEGALVHACLGDLLQALPEGEREHWAEHAVTPPVSRMFVQMRLTPGSCFDDGEVRPWE